GLVLAACHGDLPDFQLVVTAIAVHENRYQPGKHENADDDEAEIIEIIIKHADEVPETTRSVQLIAKQPQRLDAADEHRDDHRHQRDGHVVEQLADRLDEGPVVG